MINHHCNPKPNCNQASDEPCVYIQIVTQGELAHPEQHQRGVEPIGQVAEKGPFRPANSYHNFHDISDAKNPVLNLRWP